MKIAGDLVRKSGQERKEKHQGAVSNHESGHAAEEKQQILDDAAQTDRLFLILANKRLDEVKQRLSVEHYMDTVDHAKRWVSRWQDLICSQTTRERTTDLRNERSRVSNETANKELRHSKALFNRGLKKEFIESWTRCSPAVQDHPCLPGYLRNTINLDIET